MVDLVKKWDLEYVGRHGFETGAEHNGIKRFLAECFYGQFFGINEIIVLSITSLMWISNFAIPSIAGMIFVLTFDGSSLKLKQSEVLE